MVSLRPMSKSAPQWLLNNHHRDNHAELFGGDSTVFFDLDKGERYDRYDIKVDDECVVATPSGRRGADIKFCWFTFSRQELREDPRPGKDGKVRVLFGKPIKTQTLTKTAAAKPTSPYFRLFNKNGDIKAGWAIIPGTP